MEWHLVTCSKTRHIIPAQQHLFKKYAPDAKVKYLDVGDEDINTWTRNVLKRIKTNEEFIVFGLDDFLPIDYFPEFEMPDFNFDRLELGWGGSRKGLAGENFNLYSKAESYRVSCQFSIWRTDALREALAVNRSPWKFETKGTIPGRVLGLQTPFRYIEESALSARRDGKINLCGLRVEDIWELIKLGYINNNDVIYGWKGTHERTIESYGKKYAQYF